MAKESRVGSALHTLGFAAIASATAAIACGGDGSGGANGARLHVSFQADQKLSQLSSSDALAACQAAADASMRVASAPDVVRFECTLLGVLVGEQIVNGREVIDSAACKQQLDACIASPKHEGAATSTQTVACDPASVAKQFGACDATVGEWQACFNASLSTIENLAGSITCDSAASTPMPLKPYISLPTITGSAFNQQSVPECRPLAMKCPGFSLEPEPPPD